MNILKLSQEKDIQEQAQKDKPTQEKLSRYIKKFNQTPVGMAQAKHMIDSYNYAEREQDILLFTAIKQNNINRLEKEKRNVSKKN